MVATFVLAPWFPDFSVFWTAARFAVSSPHLLYDGEAITAAQSWVGHNGPRPWAYPPTALLPILPFAAMPFAIAYAAFTALSLLAFGVATKAFGWKPWLLSMLS